MRIPWALRTLFLQDLLARPLVKEEQPGGLWDRQGKHFLVFDIDGTREAARQRALPKAADRPMPSRRLRPLCAPGYTGRKRGEVVRTRTTVLQAHTHQWLATFGNPGNGGYRRELRRAVAAIQCYLQAHHHPEARALLRLDGQYGTGAVLSDLAGLAYVMRGKDYQILKRVEIQARLKLPPDQQQTHPESGMVRALYDCPDLPLGPEGMRCRLVVATHPAGAAKSRIGVTREGVVYELFVTNLPQSAFTVADVVALYLHRGAFENALADEDLEQDPDRWCSHAACGKAGMANHQPLGVEPAPRTGPSASSCSAPHHRVCSCSLALAQPRGPRAGTRTGVWSGSRGPALETRPLLRSRFCPPTGWHAALSGQPVARCPRTASRGRWEPARGVCS